MRRFFGALSVATAGLMVAVGASRIAAADESSSSADAQQAQAIRECFRQAPDLANNRIVVKVDDGIAALEGTVDSQKEKKEAQQLAHVPGILGVNNRLKVAVGGK